MFSLWFPLSQLLPYLFYIFFSSSFFSFSSFYIFLRQGFFLYQSLSVDHPGLRFTEIVQLLSLGVLRLNISFFWKQTNSQKPNKNNIFKKFKKNVYTPRNTLRRTNKSLEKINRETIVLCRKKARTNKEK